MEPNDKIVNFANKLSMPLPVEQQGTPNYVKFINHPFDSSSQQIQSNSSDSAISSNENQDD